MSISYGVVDSPEIIKEIRIPRALAAIVIGAALAVAGAIMQGITRNPLASPTLFGISSGASFMVMLTMFLTSGTSMFLMSVASFLGAFLGIALVYMVVRFSPGSISQVKLVLAGTTISTFLSGITSILGRLSNNSQHMFIWTSGGLVGVKEKQILYFTPIILTGLILALLISRKITSLSFGEEVATSLGVNVIRIKVLAMFSVLLLVGAAIAISGGIGFIGLIIPHIARKIVGQDYTKTIIFSMILGSILLLYSDLLSRMINPPYETPVGLITSTIGVMFFLYLIKRKDGRVNA